MWFICLRMPWQVMNDVSFFKDIFTLYYRYVICFFSKCHQRLLRFKDVCILIQGCVFLCVWMPRLTIQCLRMCVSRFKGVGSFVVWKPMIEYFMMGVSLFEGVRFFVQSCYETHTHTHTPWQVCVRSQDTYRIHTEYMFWIHTEYIFCIHITYTIHILIAYRLDILNTCSKYTQNTYPVRIHITYREHILNTNTLHILSEYICTAVFWHSDRKWLGSCLLAPWRSQNVVCVTLWPCVHRLGVSHTTFWLATRNWPHVVCVTLCLCVHRRDVVGWDRDPRKQKDFCTTVKKRQKQKI